MYTWLLGDLAKVIRTSGRVSCRNGAVHPAWSHQNDLVSGWAESLVVGLASQLFEVPMIIGEGAGFRH